MRRAEVAQQSRLRWVVPPLLLLAGAASAAAAAERWWPACRPGELASPACTLAQDHRFDYVVPSAPWEPLGSAAEYAAAGYLLLALAFAFMGFGRPRRLVLPLGATVALATGTIGVTTLLSGLWDRPVAPTVGGVAQLVWALAGPPVVLLLCAALTPASRRRRGLATGALLALATPIPGYLLASMVNSSHDTPAWSGAVEAVALVLAAAAGMAAWRGVDAGKPASWPGFGGVHAGERRKVGQLAGSCRVARSSTRRSDGQQDGEGGVAGGRVQLDVSTV